MNAAFGGTKYSKPSTSSKLPHNVLSTFGYNYSVAFGVIKITIGAI